MQNCSEKQAIEYNANENGPVRTRFTGEARRSEQLERLAMLVSIPLLPFLTFWPRTCAHLDSMMGFSFASPAATKGVATT